MRTRKAVRRPDGRVVRFDDNAAVLLNNKREMLGTRIGGVVSADLRMKGWGKILSLAPKVSTSAEGCACGIGKADETVHRRPFETYVDPVLSFFCFAVLCYAYTA